MKTTSLSTFLAKRKRVFLFLTAILITTVTFLGFSGKLNENGAFYIYTKEFHSIGEEIMLNVATGTSNQAYKITILKMNNPMESYSTDPTLFSIPIRDIVRKSGNVLKHYSEYKVVNIPKDSTSWKATTLSIGKVEEQGYYLIRVETGDQISYYPTIVSDYDLVTLSNGTSNMVAYAINKMSGEPLKKVRMFVKSDSTQQEITTNYQGYAFFSSESMKGNEGIITALIEGNFILTTQTYFSNYRSQKNLQGYIYTNQPVYRPNSEVAFKAILRYKDGNKTQMPAPNTSAKITVFSPKQNKILEKQASLSDLGTLAEKLTIAEAAEVGRYSIVVEVGTEKVYGVFTVEEYKKPEFKVAVKLHKSQFQPNETIKGTVTADYYFGEKVKNGTVTIKVFKREFFIPWWYRSTYMYYYARMYPLWLGTPELVNSISGEPDGEGNYTFNFPASNVGERAVEYIFQAEVTDNSGRVISGSATGVVSNTAFMISATTDKYFYKKGEAVNFTVNATDYNYQPVKTEFEIIIGKKDSKGKDNYTDTLKAKTDSTGKGITAYIVNEIGAYTYKVIAKDARNKMVTDQGTFYVPGHGDWYYAEGGQSLSISTDKELYQTGDTATVVVTVPKNLEVATLSISTTAEINAQTIRIKPGESYITTVIVTEEKHQRGFLISVSGYSKGEFYSGEKQVTVIPTNKLLTITTVTDKKQYEPGEKVNLKVKITDSKGRPVENAEFSVSTIDEALLAIKSFENEEISMFFNPADYNYLSITRRIIQRYNDSYATLSRKKILYDFNSNAVIDSKSDRERNIKIRGVIQLENITGWRENDLEVYLIDKSAGNVLDYNDLGEFRGYISNKDTVQIVVIYNNVVVASSNIITEENAGNKIIIPVKTEYLYRYYGGGAYEQHPEVAEAMGLNTQSGGRELMMKSATEDQAAAPTALAQPDVREKFVDAAYWEPFVVTNQYGEANISYDLPDNLTTWITDIKAVTADTKSGEKSFSIVARKNLMIRVENPRFYREKDTITIHTVIHNYLSGKKSVQIKSEFKNAELIKSSNTQISVHKGMARGTISVASQSEERVSYTLVVNSPNDSVKIYTEALTNEESDAVKIAIPILAYGVREVIYNNGEIGLNSQLYSSTFEIPESSNPLSANLALSLTPSLGGTVLQSLDDLIEYPYGCVEQTMSRFLPAIITASTLKELRLPQTDKIKNELPKVVDAGLKRLYDMQHADGGWGWWKNDNTNPYMTSYVVYGLSYAKSLGYDISESVLDQGLAKLEQLLTEESGFDNPTNLAYGYFSYSAAAKFLGKELPQKIKNTLLQKKVKKLSDFELALYLLALISANERESASPFVTRLIENGEDLASVTYWGDSERYYYWTDDRVQTTAFAVKALLAFGENNEEAARGIRWLLKQQQGFSWRSTQQTATVLFALTDYLKATSELESNYTATVKVNGKVVGEISVNKENILQQPKVITVNAPTLRVGKNEIEVEKRGTGVVYFSSVTSYYNQNASILNPSPELNISREYYKLEMAPKREGGFNYNKTSAKNLVSGDVVLVKIKVTSKTSGANYLMVEDMLPSGFEVIKEDELYEIKGEALYNGSYYGNYPWRWSYSQREFRDERVSFFVTSGEKEMEFTYLMRAQLPGTVNVMPAEVQLMYYPEIRSVSELNKLSIKMK